MDHPCHRCGANVADGTPFCAQCGAPQIRVNIEAAEPPPVPVDGSVPPLPPFHTPSAGPRIIWRSALPRALGAAVLLILLVVLAAQMQSVLLMVMVIVLSGGLAVWLYSMRPDVGIITGGMGAMLGAVTGFFASCAIAALMLLTFMSNREGALNQLKAALQQQAARNPDPNSQKMIESMISNPESLIGAMFFGLIVMLVFLLAFSTIGGVLGAVVLRRR